MFEQNGKKKKKHPAQAAEQNYDSKEIKREPIIFNELKLYLTLAKDELKCTER